jgi:hypothetical protein
MAKYTVYGMRPKNQNRRIYGCGRKTCLNTVYSAYGKNTVYGSGSHTAYTGGTKVTRVNFKKKTSEKINDEQ